MSTPRGYVRLALTSQLFEATDSIPGKARFTFNSREVTTGNITQTREVRRLSCRRDKGRPEIRLNDRAKEDIARFRTLD
jgi:hypothetical protein